MMKTSQQVQPTHSIKIPPGFCPESSGGGKFLIVPIEPTLEERAKRLIASPQDFAPKGVTLDASGCDMLRLGGVNSLRYFKSDANAALLRKIFESGDDPQRLRAICELYEPGDQVIFFLWHDAKEKTWRIFDYIPLFPEKIRTERLRASQALRPPEDRSSERILHFRTEQDAGLTWLAIDKTGKWIGDDAVILDQITQRVNAGSRVPRGIDRQAVLDGKSQFGGFYVYERQEPAVSSAEFPVVLVPPDPEYRAWYLKIVRDLMSHQGQLQTFEPIANYKDAEVIAALKLRLTDNLVHELGFKLPERTTHGSTFFIMTPDVPPLKAEPNIEKSRTYIIRKAAWNALRQMEVQVDPLEFDANVSGVTAEAPPTRSDLKAERDARRLWWPRPLPPQRGGGELVAAPMDDGPDGVESDLPLLSSLPNLRGFYFEDDFSPDGWDEIGRLKQLEILRCNSNYITDRDLNCLQHLADLKELALYGSGPRQNPFTDASLPPIAKMRRLQKLVLHSGGITDAGLNHLESLQALKSLEIEGLFTDVGLEFLKKLPNLRELILKVHFSDKGLVHLCGITSLETLTLVSDKLTGSRSPGPAPRSLLPVRRRIRTSRFPMGRCSGSRLGVGDNLAVLLADSCRRPVGRFGRETNEHANRDGLRRSRSRDEPH